MFVDRLFFLIKMSNPKSLHFQTPTKVKEFVRTADKAKNYQPKDTLNEIVNKSTKAKRVFGNAVKPTSKAVVRVRFNPTRPPSPEIDEDDCSGTGIRIKPINARECSPALRPLKGKAKEIFPNLNDGILCLCVAKPNQGKTTMCMNILLNKELCGPTNVNTNQGGCFHHVYVLSSNKADPNLEVFKQFSWVSVLDVSDAVLQAIVETQQQYDIAHRPPIAIYIMDSLGTKYLETLARTYRQNNIKLLLVEQHTLTTGFPMLRKMVNMLILWRTDYANEMNTIADAYGNSFGGPDMFKEYWVEATKYNQHTPLVVNLVDRKMYSGMGECVLFDENAVTADSYVRNFLKNLGKIS